MKPEPKPIPESDLYNVKAAAAYLGIHLTSLYRLIYKGKGPEHGCVGNKYRFTKKQLDDYLLSRAKRPKNVDTTDIPAEDLTADELGF